MSEEYRKPNLIVYRGVQLAARFFSALVFKKKERRNEIRRLKGPYVIIANHQAAYDFVNLIGATRRRITFVLSNAFYQTLPSPRIADLLGVIPKQQFQTAPNELKRMRAVIRNGAPLAIYPAGLMCEDGRSTPIPAATCKLLRWLDTDVYVAKTSGTYFVQPKWSHGFRAGRTYMDISRLLTKEELRSLSPGALREKVEEALSFDAYQEQETLQCRYRNGNDLEGLENVLYRCPACGKEFTIRVRDRDTLFCTACGYEERSDRFGILHNEKGIGPELRHASGWSRMIYEETLEELRRAPETSLSAATRIALLDYEKHKFVDSGSGTVSISGDRICLNGTVNGEKLSLSLSLLQFPTLPFVPGKQIELQDREVIYRCVLEDGALAMKFINHVKAYYELHHAERPGI